MSQKIEESLTRIENELGNVKNRVIGVESSVVDLGKYIIGDCDKLGIKTEVELQKGQIKRLWWFIGLITTAVLGSIGTLFFLVISKV